ncbi:hypothetical protein CNBG_9534 [Cryptococcus deuterogattii R265]|uniref:uncharacterized protein n=1 Tax=Cryptococcus deuterogattii (strain R265) TaxID=294750 RepID=UPI001938ADA6|nr:hypothetical protein CNBG_9534 [Cryptococcus deuterogattii R265]
MIGHCTTTNYASLYPLGFPHILDGGGSRGVPTASPSDPSSITKGTAPADAPASSPPFLPMAYDFILTCRDSVVAGAILLRLDPSIHETFVPIAMDGLGNYTHRLYLALSLSFGHHGPHHVYASITELFEMECGEGDDVDWEDLHVNALLHGLPPRFPHWRDQQFGETARKKTTDSELIITNIDTASSYSASSSPAALAASVYRSDENLAAFYTKISRKGRKPSDKQQQM